MATIHLRGKATQTCGQLPAIGEAAPGFSLLDDRLQVRTLSEFSGRCKLIYALPSLDTPVCAQSTLKLVEHCRAANLIGNGNDDEVVILIISADLPFAQQRFCKQHKLNDVTTLSLHRDTAFGVDYGLLINDGPLAGLTARALLVLDEQDRIVYTELVDEISAEPDYAAALQALKNILATA